MPVEIGLEMYAEKPVVLPFFTSHVARGLLLHVVRQVDPNASGLLHELNVSKPYSVTPLRFRSRGRAEGGYVLDPMFPCRIDFSARANVFSSLNFSNQWQRIFGNSSSFDQGKKLIPSRFVLLLQK